MSLHSFEGDCGYGLMKDVVSNRFTVVMTTTHDCVNRSSSPCLESLTLKVEKDAFRLTLNGKHTTSSEEVEVSVKDMDG